MIRRDGRHRVFRPGYEWRLPAIGGFVFAILACLFVFDRALYTAILSWWIAKPFETPFIDIDGVLEAHTCWRLGYDVYRDAPCDVLGRTFPYSPLWLRMDFLPPRLGSPPWTGFALTAAYLAALGALPRLERGVSLVVLGAAGSLPVFAMERANVDEAILVLVVVAAHLLTRRPLTRIIGYGLIATAAALKFYPLAAFVVAARERLRAAAALTLLVMVAVAAFVLAYRDELREIVLPQTMAFTDSLGAEALPHGVRVLVHRTLQARGAEPATIARVAHLSVSVLRAGLVASAAFLVTVILAQRNFTFALRRLPATASVMLTIAAALFCGCFIAYENVGYRAVLLLPALPVLIGLSQGASNPGMRILFASAVSAVICGLWMLTFQRGVAFVCGGFSYPIGGSVAGFVFWVVRELAWWWVATVLAAALVRQTLDGAAIRELQSLLAMLAGRVRRALGARAAQATEHRRPDAR